MKKKDAKVSGRPSVWSANNFLGGAGSDFLGVGFRKWKIIIYEG